MTKHHHTPEEREQARAAYEKAAAQRSWMKIRDAQQRSMTVSALKTTRNRGRG